VKRLALRARGLRAEQVRTYFIRMEEAWRKYMQGEIAQRLKEEDPEVTCAKQQRRSSGGQPVRAQRGPGVYAISTDHKGRRRYKIGESTDMNDRYAVLRRTLPGTVALDFWQPTDHEAYVEKCVHEILHDKAEGHEQFHTDLPTIRKAVALCMENRATLIREAAALGVTGQTPDETT